MPTQFDDRGVSEVVGAILVFGILIAALGVYQGFMVPDENSDAEFSHEGVVIDDLVETRNAILESASTNQEQYASVKLGTRYADRMVAINPPNPTGTLSTVEGGEYVVYNENDSTVTDQVLGNGNKTEASTKFLTYEANYNEFDGHAPLTYENTILYSEYADIVTRTSQQLVVGDRVLLSPLTHEFYAEGVEKTSLEFYPGFRNTEFLEDPTITVPTKLTNGTWENILEDELEGGSLEDISPHGENSLNFTFNGTIEVIGSPVGIGDYPETGPRDEDTDDTGDDDNKDINPIGPGQLELVSVDPSQGRSIPMKMTFHNNGSGQRTVTDVRVAWFTVHSRGGLDFGFKFEDDTPVEASLYGQWEPTGNWSWSSDTNHTVALGEINDGELDSLSNKGGIAFVFKFTDRSTSTYFVTDPQSS